MILVKCSHQGDYHFCLENDNFVTGVDVTVHIVAITVKEEWGVKKVLIITDFVEIINH